ncbi:pentatricopeptide repeat-containing At1g19720 [Olea europaea subsp. europaea]|uniref:Pentatricopeptide repeat-containing At1g19720 n=1 Tax=Olea europaea subsp. europaea TaxID=158383 RepID=A0A8S0UJP7_OLEEU|nr:pentatricopeptide repeat-containing At1g19720 [Olea europaea subsp. europaea]
MSDEFKKGVPSKQDSGAGGAKGSDRVRHALMLQSFPVNHFERSHYFLLKNVPPNPDSKLNAHLKNLCKNGHLSEAMASYSIVKYGSTVRFNTLSYLIDYCIDSNSFDLCYKLHGYVRKLREESDPFVETKLVSMYAKYGSLENAFEVFDAMSE